MRSLLGCFGSRRSVLASGFPSQVAQCSLLCESAPLHTTRSEMKKSYCTVRSQQIGEHGPAIGKCEGMPIYEWIRIAANPKIRYVFAGMAPSPLPATIIEPGKTILTVVVQPGLAYEPAA